MSEIQTRYREDGSTDWPAMLEDLMGREWVDAFSEGFIIGKLGEEEHDPMLPDPVALSQHEPTLQAADSRDSAGLGAGPMEREPIGTRWPPEEREPWPEEIDPLAYRTYA